MGFNYSDSIQKAISEAPTWSPQRVDKIVSSQHVKCTKLRWHGMRCPLGSIDLKVSERN